MVTNQRNIIKNKFNEQNSFEKYSVENQTRDNCSEYKPTKSPSSLDEGWWESVLAEDEANDHQNHTTYVGKPNVHTSHANSVPIQEPGEMDWEKAQSLYEKDQAINMSVVGYNRGGVLVNGEGLQGFVPVSHLVETPCTNTEPEEWLASYIDRPLMLKVIECDPERGRIVFSERAALSEPGSRVHLLNHLKPGDHVCGKITNITDFGVFVDLGGVEGLIHVSEISWGRVHHPADVVKLDQLVDVYVIQVDRERARVALSLKRLHPNPWETAPERYCPGQIIEATVTSVVPFGAFARLEEGLDGLIHISEMTPGTASDAKNLSIQEGQTIKVRIIHVDSDRQRLGLSLNLVE